MSYKDKVNNHKILNKYDINKVINERLEELKIRRKNIAKLVQEKDVSYMAYDIEKNCVVIDKSYKKTIIAGLLSDVSIKLVKNKNNNTFIKDAYNLDLISSLYHELRHKEQYNLYFDERTDYNYLLKLSLEYMQVNYGFYTHAHDLFLSEYDAEMSCFKELLDKIEKEYTNINDSVIYNTNSLIAYVMLKARGYILEDKKLVKKYIFNSPLHFLTYLTNMWYKDNKKYRYYYNKNIETIKRVRSSAETEYEKLLVGDNISESLINELHLITLGKIKTKNIFKYLENKYKNEKCKCLCKKIQK